MKKPMNGKTSTNLGNQAIKSLSELNQYNMEPTITDNRIVAKSPSSFLTRCTVACFGMLAFLLIGSVQLTAQVCEFSAIPDPLGTTLTFELDGSCEADATHPNSVSPVYGVLGGPSCDLLIWYTSNDPNTVKGGDPFTSGIFTGDDITGPTTYWIAVSQSSSLTPNDPAVRSELSPISINVVDIIAPTLDLQNDPLPIQCAFLSSASPSADELAAFVIARVIPDPVSISQLNRTSTYSNVNVNGTGDNVAVVAPGSNITLSFDRATVVNTPDGNVTQHYIGVAGGPAVCLFSAVGAPPNSSYALNFNVSTTPGIYYITQTATWQFGCVPVTAPYNPNLAIGAVVVTNDPVFTLGAADNCGLADTVYTLVAEDVVCDGSGIVREYTLSVVVFDESGNASAAEEFVVVVEDQVSEPAATIANNNTTINCEDTPPTPEWELDFAAGACVFADTEDILIEEDGDAVITPGSCEFNFTVTQSYIITYECNGNTQNIDFVYTVQDVEAPVLDGDLLEEAVTFAVEYDENEVDGETLTITARANNVDAADDPCFGCLAIDLATEGFITDNCSDFEDLEILYQVTENDDIVIGDPDPEVFKAAGDATPTVLDRCYPIGTSTVAFTITDACNNSSEYIITIEVLDLDPPIDEGCPEDIVVDALEGECSRIVQWLPPTAEDCSDFEENLWAVGPGGQEIIILGPTGDGEWFAEFSVGISTVYHEFIDEFDNADTCIFTVEVIDTQAPEVVAEETITVQLDANGMATIVENDFIISIDDNCQALDPTEFSPSTFTCENVGANDVTVTVSDTSGNDTTFIVVVIVEDNVAPVLVGGCDDIILFYEGDCGDPQGDCGIVLGETLIAPEFDDACGIDEVVGVRSDGMDLDDAFPVGTTTITWTATDVNGNTAQCEQDVIIIDNEAPQIEQLADIEILLSAANPDGCNATATWADPVVTDCSNVVISQTDASGDLFELGVSIVQYTVTDANGNACNMSFTVTVIDDVPPTVSCQESPYIIQSICDDVPLPDFSPLVTASDNCAGPLTYTQDPAIGTPLVDIFGEGNVVEGATAVITMTVTDASDNTNTCEVTIQLVDLDAPVPALAELGDITPFTTPGASCGSLIVEAPVAYDCQGNPIYGTPSTSSGAVPGSNPPAYFFNTPTFSPGVQITWTYNNPNGLSAQQQQFIQVIDDAEAPVLTCPADLTLGTSEDGEGDCIVNITDAGYDISMSFGEAPTVLPIPTPAAGTVNDNCEVVSIWYDVYSDNDGMVIYTDTIHLADGDSTIDAGDNIFAAGAYVITYYAEDGSGLIGSCSFNVVVEDDEAPIVLACPEDVEFDIVVNEEDGECTYTISEADLASVTPAFSDNCEITDTTWSIVALGVGSATPASGSGTLLGVEFDITGSPTGSEDFEVTFIVTDTAGNPSDPCVFIITINDATDPFIVCADDATRAANDVTVGDGLACVYVAEGDEFDPVVTFDNCDIASVTHDWDDAPSDTTLDGAIFPLDPDADSENPTVHVVTWTIVDNAGNESECTIEITIVDESAPVWDYVWNINGLTCGETLDLFVTDTDCEAFFQWMRPGNMNVDDCTAFSITESITESIANFNAQFNVNQIYGVYDQDNPNLVSVNLPQGLTTFTYVATDAFGNTSVCEFYVNVIDNIAPVVTCPSNTTVGVCDTFPVPTYTFQNVVENCSYEITQIPAPGTLLSEIPGLVIADGESFEVTLIATDPQGNQDACTFLVFLDDSEFPVPSVGVAGGFLDPINPQTFAGASCGIITVPAPVATTCDQTIYGVPTLSNGLVPGSNPPAYFFTSSTFYAMGSGVQITWTYQNTNNGNTVLQSQHILVTDDEVDPTVNVFFDGFEDGGFTLGTSDDGLGDCEVNPSDAGRDWTVTANPNPNVLPVPNPAVGEAIDNCGVVSLWFTVEYDGEVVFTSSTSAVSVDPADFTYQLGVSTVTVYAEDAAGNVGSASFTVTVVDDESPIFADCPIGGSGEVEYAIGQNPARTKATSSVCGFTAAQPTGACDCPTGYIAVGFSGTAGTHWGPNVISSFVIHCRQVLGNGTFGPLTDVTCSNGSAVGPNTLPTVMAPEGHAITGASTGLGCALDRITGRTKPLNDILAGSPNTTFNTMPDFGGSGGSNQNQNVPNGNVIIGMQTYVDPSNSNITGGIAWRYANLEEIVLAAATIVMETDPGFCFATEPVEVPEVTDNCGVVSYTVEITNLDEGVVFSGNVSDLPEELEWPLGLNNVVFIATDAAGNSSECSYSVLVIDTDRPEITCPDDIAVENDPGVCGAVVDYDLPAVSDNCPGDLTLQQAQGLPSGSTFPVGTTTNIFIVTDASGNTQICSFDVTVTDTEAPAFVNYLCGETIQVNNLTGDCFNNVEWTRPGFANFSDNCTAPQDLIVTEEVVDNPTVVIIPSGFVPGGNAFASFPVGITTIRYTLTDEFGNMSECFLNIEVIDTEAPTINCPGSFTFPSVCPEEVFSDLTSIASVDDNCDDYVVTQSPAAGMTLSQILGGDSNVVVGASFDVTFTVTDSYNNSATCVTTVTLQNIQSPIPTVGVDGGVLPALTPTTDIATTCAPYIVHAPTATANCGADTIIGTLSAGGAGVTPIGDFPFVAYIFEPGNYTITWIYNDGNVNTPNASQIQVIQVAPDNIAPVVNCPDPVVVSADAGECSSSNVMNIGLTAVNFANLPDFNAFTPAPGQFADNCAATVQYSLSGATTVALTSGADAGVETFNVGVTTVTYVITDDAGNSVSCSFTVTVEDNEAPMFAECPVTGPVTLVEENFNSASLPLGWDVTSNGSVGWQIGTTATTGNVGSGIDGTPYAFVNSDAAGSGHGLIESHLTTSSVNTEGLDNLVLSFDYRYRHLGASAFFSVEVWDGENWQEVLFTNSSVANPPVTNFSMDVTQYSNADFKARFHYTDGGSWAWWVLVDNVELSGESFIIASTDEGQCYATAPITAPDVTDNCGVSSYTAVVTDENGDVVFSGNVPAAPIQWPLGVNNVVLTVTDAAGNSNTCSYDVLVIDEEAPMIACPEVDEDGIFVTLGTSHDGLLGNCATSFTWNHPVASDNCLFDFTVTYTNPDGSVQTADAVSGGLAARVFDLGLTQVTYTATDNSGNVTTCSFYIEVVDNEAPIAICDHIVIALNEQGYAIVTQAVIENNINDGSYDNCGPLTFSVNQDTFFCSDLGVNPIQLVVTDAAGNVSICNTTVTVLDNNFVSDPTFPADITITNCQDPNDTNLTGFVTGNTPCDVSDIDYTDVVIPGDCPGNYVVVRTWSVFDAAGIATVHVQTITVVDNQGPIFTGLPSNFSVDNCEGLAALISTPGSVQAFDCPGDAVPLEITYTSSVSSCSGGVYNITRTWMATDACGNSSTATQLITVTDTLAPVITGPSEVTVNVSGHDVTTCEASVDLMVSVTDCNLAGPTVVTNSFNAGGANASGIYPVGTTTVVFTATDACGNSSTHTTEVTVADDVNPVAICLESFNVVLNNQGVGTIFPWELDNGSYDNCENITMFLNEVGMTSLTFTCEDLGPQPVTLVVQDDAGNINECVTIVNVMANSADQLEVTVETTDVTAVGGNDGTATAVVTGGSGNYAYWWSNGETTQTITGLTAGVYSVTVSDLNPANCATAEGSGEVMGGAPITFHVGSAAGAVGDIVEVPVTVENFANILGFQFSIDVVDASIGQIVGFSNFGLPGLTADDFNPAEGTVSWVNSLPQAVTLADGTVIFHIQVQLVGGMTGSTSDVVINSDPLVLEVIQEQGGLAVQIPADDVVTTDGEVEVTQGLTGPFAIGGNIITEDGLPVALVDVDMTGDVMESMTTTTNGTYFFDEIPLGSDVMVTPSKDVNHLNGVTTFDAVLLQRHLIGTEILGSPYKKIAADIDANGILTVGDLIQLRRVILLIDNDFVDPFTGIKNNTSWRFALPGLTDPAPASMVVPAYTEARTYNNLSTDFIADHYIAVKIGDLNNSVSPNAMEPVTGDNAQPANYRSTLAMVVNDVEFRAGETFTVDFLAKDFVDVAGYQFTFNFEAAQLNFAGVEAGDLRSLSADNFGLTFVEEGAVTVSWNEINADLQNDAVLFSITFEAIANGTLSNAIEITSDLIRVEGYRSNGEFMDITIQYTGGIATRGEFILYQNEPNPFVSETRIGFELPEATNGTLSIFDGTGRLLRSYPGEFVQGYNEISVERGDLPVSGVLYYQLSTSTHSATKKMIIAQ